MDRYYETATPAAIAEHAAAALQWIDRHPSHAPARTALIYAWDEDDEGGWLIPTYNGTPTGDTSRLDALKKVLRGAS